MPAKRILYNLVSKMISKESVSPGVFLLGSLSRLTVILEYLSIALANLVIAFIEGICLFLRFRFLSFDGSAVNEKNE